MKGYFQKIAVPVIISICMIFLLEIFLRMMGFSPVKMKNSDMPFIKYHSTLGWEHQAGKENIFNKGRFSINVNINSQGLRDDNHSYQRNNEKKRIMVLGDSFAWGYGVEQKDRFSEILERSLNAEFINAAVMGYSTDQQLLWYKKEGVKYDVDVVLLVFCGNDETHNHCSRVYSFYHKPVFTFKNNKLVLQGVPVPKMRPLHKVIYFLRQTTACFNYLEKQLMSFPWCRKQGFLKIEVTELTSKIPAHPFEITKALINEIKDISEAKGAQFIIITTASQWWWSPSGKSYNEFIDTLIVDGLFVLDVDALPGYQPDVMTIPVDGHWNKFGHNFVAEEVQRFVEKKHLLD